MNTPASRLLAVTVVNPSTDAQYSRSISVMRIQRVEVAGDTAPTGANCQIIYNSASVNTDASPYTERLFLTITIANLLAAAPHIISLTKTAATGGQMVYLHSGLINKISDETTRRWITFLQGKGEEEFYVTETKAAIEAATEAAAAASLVTYPKQTWVSSAGDDTTATIGDPGRPYLTVQTAIDAVNTAGGGTIFVLDGATWGTTTIQLRSNVVLKCHNITVTWGNSTAIFGDTNAPQNAIVQGGTFMTNSATAQFWNFTNASSSISFDSVNFVELTAFTAASTVTNSSGGTGTFRWNYCTFTGSTSGTRALIELEAGNCIFDNTKIKGYMASEAVNILGSSAFVGIVQFNGGVVQSGASSNWIDAVSSQTVYVAAPVGVRFASSSNVTIAPTGGERVNTTFLPY